MEQPKMMYRITKKGQPIVYDIMTTSGEIWSLGIEVIVCKHLENAEWGRIRFGANHFWILMWNQTPGAAIESGGMSYELSKDCVCLIAPHTLRHYTSETPFTQFYIQFTLTGNVGAVTPGVYRMPSGFVKKIHPEIMKNPDEMSRMLAVNSVVAHYLSRLPSGTFSMPGGKAMDPRIEKALSIIDAEYMRPIPLLSLCRRVGMSQNNFLRNFSRYLGISPEKYIGELRCRHAEQLLRFTNKSIPEIAEELGYVDRYHFSKRFKNYGGVSPAEFRKHLVPESGKPQH